MTKTFKLINKGILNFDYEELTTYTTTYYAFSGCSCVEYELDGQTTILNGDTISFKNGLIQVYEGPDLLARLQIPSLS